MAKPQMLFSNLGHFVKRSEGLDILILKLLNKSIVFVGSKNQWLALGECSLGQSDGLVEYLFGLVELARSHE